MVHNYPIHFADQLRQHLRALRKHRGMTQTRLGQILGVSQARIAEIEANPGLVNLDQMLQVFSALDLTLSLAENHPVPVATAAPPSITGHRTGKTKPALKPKAALAGGQRYNEYIGGPRYGVNAPSANYNPNQIHRVADDPKPGAPTSSDELQADASPESTSEEAINQQGAQSREQGIKSDAQSITPGSFKFHPKKGSW
jgi:transcriptional regulator with XRE-family HTH domain